jgi:1,4-alpha-glucan branching enzyme
MDTTTRQQEGTIGDARYDVTLLDANVVHLFNEGTLDRAHRVLGAHLHVTDGVAGTYFAVWAPNANYVSVVGDFNGWRRDKHPLRMHGQSGIWEAFVPGIARGTIYKYHIVGRGGAYWVDKADPYGFRQQIAPEKGSIVWDLDYTWGDDTWIEQRTRSRSLERPMSIYEVHLGSWLRVPEEGNRSLSYREIAPRLADYVERMGFTHVEIMPVMEHPFYGSWGYQITGYFAPTGRYGTPQDFMYLVDLLHQRGIGVILDWVPSHFPTDAHGLSYFDGTHLYEHADPRLGHHKDWDSYIFNYGRYEVQNFLRSNALFWLEAYHADGLRVDAVASMLHLDFSRREGEWIPNRFGGRENLEAIDFLRRLNESVYRDHPGTDTIAEDSTAWPMVSRPVYVGGLGFGMKWDMGWMHDTLKYFAQDPLFRRYHHQKVTFRMMYAFSENYVLPISHDEVVHGKGSLINKMSGDPWQKRANLRLLLGYMFAQPGKKLLFMGCEFGQYSEWNHDASLDWHLLQLPEHAAVQQWVADLNALYRNERAMHELDSEPSGFEWVDCSDADQSIVSLLRYAKHRDEAILVVCNFTPVPRPNFRLGVPVAGHWEEVLNSDAGVYGGAGWGNYGGVDAVESPIHGRPFSVTITLPPLSTVFFRMPKVVVPAETPGDEGRDETVPPDNGRDDDLAPDVVGDDTLAAPPLDGDVPPAPADERDD